MSERLEDNASLQTEQDLKEIIANLYLANDTLRKRVAKTESLEEALAKALERVEELEDALRTLGSADVSSVTEVRKIVVACLKVPHAPTTSEKERPEGPASL